MTAPMASVLVCLLRFMRLDRKLSLFLHHTLDMSLLFFQKIDVSIFVLSWHL